MKQKKICKLEINEVQSVTKVYYVRHAESRNVSALLKLIEHYKGKNIVIGGHGTALSTIINYFDASFGYEEFTRMKNKMPWIVEFQFDSEAHCHAICKHDLF